MRQVLFCLLVLFTGVQSSFAMSWQPSPGSQKDFVPWPWGAESPFPWKTIEGVWYAEVGGRQPAIFVFKPVVIRGVTALKIQLYSVGYCQVFAEGYAAAQVNTVLEGFVQEIGPGKRMSKIQLRAFPEELLRGSNLPPAVDGHYLALSYAFGFTDVETVPLQKISNSTQPQCFRH